MFIIDLDLPEDMWQFVDEEMKDGKFKNYDEYFTALVQADKERKEQERG